ncbi:vesicular glutamate transporter 1 [Thrips palmi]|uniref:Sialin n=1 Tax=Thrips palmi TaxID=161013 RepID=A0A6P8YPB0_THRPL|nr:vesicular glutamate transporter 1 [Thrips palmi]
MDDTLRVGVPAAVASYGAAEASEHGDEEHASPGWRFWRRRRYVVASMAFLGFFNVYALRVNLSVAIVAMTAASNATLGNGTTVQVPAEFDWDSKTQGLILSSFFYGYLVTQVPGGWLAARVGGSRVYGVGLAATAFLTILTPPLARAGTGWLVAVRVVEGLFEGVTYPCIHAVWARWAPPAERSRLATIAFSGSYAGTVVSLPLCGVIAARLGWPAIFYIFGVLGLVWYAFWLYIVKENPADDPHISRGELRYLQKTLASVPDAKMASQPWGSFLTSAPVWAIVAAHFSENWGFYTLLTQLPTFMRDVLHVQIEQSGVLSALPYVCMSVILQAAGHFADWLRAGRMSTTAVRKLFNCGAFLSQTVFMMVAAYATSAWAIVLCITVAVGLGGFAWSAFSVNHLDIAPQYASILMGISNTVATLPGMISPHITGYIVQDKTPSQWRTVFMISSSIYLAGALIYGIFASGERQPWADDTPSNKSTFNKKPGTRTRGHTNEALELGHDD